MDPAEILKTTLAGISKTSPNIPGDFQKALDEFEEREGRSLADSEAIVALMFFVAGAQSEIKFVHNILKPKKLGDKNE